MGLLSKFCQKVTKLLPSLTIRLPDPKTELNKTT